MSGNYNPDEAAEPNGTWSTVFLSNRDLSAQIPVNFVPHPGAYLTPVCFSNGTYTASIAEKCVSNLLAAQFRRLIVDLYWDDQNDRFTFCPVSIPAATGNGHATISYRSSLISAASTTSGKGNVVARQATSVSSDVTSAPSSTGAGDNSTSNAAASSTSTSAPPPIQTLPSINGETLYSLGPYACSPALDLSFFISVMSDYLSATSNTVDAKIIQLVLNLHAAASRTRPEEPAPEPTSFPRGDVLVGTQFSALDKSPIYQPSDLASERFNLKDTWFKNPEIRWPVKAYFTEEETPGGDSSTSNGWPDESYVQLTLAKRILLSWGSIDPQMALYNFSGDASTIFATNQLATPHTIRASANGTLTSGCLYNSATPLSSVLKANSSWALTSYDSSTFQSDLLVSNLTTCGLSPVLNHTLPSGSASDNIAAYKSIPHSAIWNWAPGEPRNTSAPGVDLDAPESQFRCAYFDARNSFGRWSVQDCLHNYAVACRVNNQPYIWTISRDSVAYGSGTDVGVCPVNTSFSVPMTGLENAALYETILTQRQHSNSEDPEGVWVNFNSLDLRGCWVTTGPNGTCPYFEDPNQQQSRQILVPTIAAIIILIVTALTIFVKCDVNRRNSKHRRRGEGGWDYEGVPS